MRQPHRRRRARSLWLIAAALATIPPATGRAVAQRSDEADRQERTLAFSQCMRDNGVPEFPDPDPQGFLRFQLEQSSPEDFRDAQEACRDLSPFNVAAGPPTPEQMEQLVALAQCLRDNGVADFPDPNAQGEFRLTGSDIDIESPTAEAAMRMCMEAGAAAAARSGASVRIVR